MTLWLCCSSYLDIGRLRGFPAEFCCNLKVFVLPDCLTGDIKEVDPASAFEVFIGLDTPPLPRLNSGFPWILLAAYAIPKAELDYNIRFCAVCVVLYSTGDLRSLFI